MAWLIFRKYRVSFLYNAWWHNFENILPSQRFNRLEAYSSENYFDLSSWWQVKAARAVVCRTYFLGYFDSMNSTWHVLQAGSCFILTDGETLWCDINPAELQFLIHCHGKFCFDLCNTGCLYPWKPEWRDVIRLNSLECDWYRNQ